MDADTIPAGAANRNDHTVIARLPMKSAALLLLTLALLTGCASHQPMGRLLDREGIIALNGSAADAPFRLTPGDRVAVKFFYNKELNEEVTIRPDGKISLQLVDEVMAAGRTPEELGRLLTLAYAKAFGTNSDRYLLGIGERVSIKSFYHDKLNEDVVIRPDGKISMQLAGEVQAAGVSPNQLAATIAERLRSFLDAPDVSVIVRDFRRPELSVIVRESAAQRIFVGGEVKQSGVLLLHGGLGLLAATVQAGGVLDSARLEDVVLLRHDSASEPTIYSINLKSILQGETMDLALRPMDVVYVPKSAAADAAATIRQRIYNLLPSQFMFSMGYQLNPQVQIKTTQ
jgi:protein involved in polysaccharide export with SLBB domain